MREIISALFIGLGLLFNVFGCFGLLRLPGISFRLQPTIKLLSFGACLIFFGLFIKSGMNITGIKSLVCILMILLVSQASAHALSAAAVNKNREE